MKIEVRCFNGETMVSPDYIDRNGVAHWTEDSIPTTSTNIMLFTGLYDKDKSKVFEGDIFQVANNVNYVVKYCEGAESNYEYIGGCFIIYRDEKTFYPFDEYAIEHGKVIGNIYENPELLNNAKKEEE